MKRFGIGLLRLLIGIGFTFSLVFGATLTILALFHGPGDSLVLNRPGPDWGWGYGAAIAWASALFWWFCWRFLPPVKPTPMFPALKRSLQRPGSIAGRIFSIAGRIFSTFGVIYGAFLMLEMGAELASHAAGASWFRFWYYCAITYFNGSWAMSNWKNRKLQ